MLTSNKWVVANSYRAKSFISKRLDFLWPVFLFKKISAWCFETGE